MKEIEKQTIKFAFIQTIPILFSYVFIGIAFGIILQQAGYNFIWAFFISIFVYSGAIQFVLITFLSTGASITTVLMTTIFISGRHIFYGLSFIDTFKKMGEVIPVYRYF